MTARSVSLSLVVGSTSLVALSLADFDATGRGNFWPSQAEAKLTKTREETTKEEGGENSTMGLNKWIYTEASEGRHLWKTRCDRLTERNKEVNLASLKRIVYDSMKKVRNPDE